MSLPRTLTFFAALIWAVLMVLPAQAEVDPKNTGKTSKQQVSQEQVNQPVQEDELNQDQTTEKEEEKSETSRMHSNSSLNFIFYMIYKVKFEDLFRVPERNNINHNLGLRLINLGANQISFKVF